MAARTRKSSCLFPKMAASIMLLALLPRVASLFNNNLGECNTFDIQGTNCATSYKKCNIDNKWEVKQCSWSNHVFVNGGSMSGCKDISDTQCPLKPGQCKRFEKPQGVDCATTYKECSFGQWRNARCMQGWVFMNNARSRPGCTSIRQTSCRNGPASEPTTKPPVRSVCQEGQWKATKACSRDVMKCVSGQWKSGFKCNPNEVFVYGDCKPRKEVRACNIAPGSGSTTKPPVQSVCVEGQWKATKACSRDVMKCISGQWKSGFKCNPNEVFENGDCKPRKEVRACNIAPESSTKPPVQAVCKDGQWRSTGNLCSRDAMKCVNGQWQSGYHCNGNEVVENGACKPRSQVRACSIAPESSTKPPVQAVCQDGQLKSSGKPCSRDAMKCVNGQWQSGYHCNLNEVFDNGACKPRSQVRACGIAEIKEQCEYGSAKGDKCATNLYRCQTGKWTPHTCKPGMVFDGETDCFKVVPGCSDRENSTYG